MEQEQRLVIEALRRECVFSDVCSSWNCGQCVDKGLNYLATRLYVPKSLIPRGYYFVTLSDLSLSGNLSSNVWYYINNIWDMVSSGRGFYAYSEEPGTGKTSVGCIALRHYLYHSIKRDPYNTDNRRSLYINIPEFLNRVRKSFNQEDPELDQLLEELMNIDTAPKLVLFDDIGAEKPSEWVMERLYTLINFRVSNGLASIYTSNEPTLEKLGRRISSRVESTSKKLFFSGRDRRETRW